MIRVTVGETWQEQVDGVTILHARLHVDDVPVVCSHVMPPITMTREWFTWLVREGCPAGFGWFFCMAVGQAHVLHPVETFLFGGLSAWLAVMTWRKLARKWGWI